jgi:hypothetical protein
MQTTPNAYFCMTAVFGQLLEKKLMMLGCEERQEGAWIQGISCSGRWGFKGHPSQVKYVSMNHLLSCVLWLR